MKNLLIAFLALTFTFTVQAQDKNSFSLSVGGGYHQLSYSLDNGTSKNYAGFSISAGYSIFFSQNWGISTGAGIQTYKSTATINFLSKVPDIDSDGDAYELRTSYNGWEEDQKVYFIDVPLALTFKSSFGSNAKLLASLGGKISFPINAKYTATRGTITTTGYYSQWNVELSDIPEEGFSTYNGRPSGDLSLRPAFSLLADIGASFQINNATSLYLGAYTNYSLNNILKADTKSIYLKDGTYNGLFASNHIDNIKPFAIGIKIGVIWNF